jgi:uncharacterized LabA/DUF88 family protein
VKNIAYIDGANLHKGVETLGWKLDYKKFRVWLRDKYSIEVAKIFMGKVSGYSGMYKNLQDAGFVLIFKKVVRGEDGKIKGNCDAELVTEALSDYYEKRMIASTIISSDGDFSVLGKFLKEKGALKGIISPRNSCSSLLRNLGAPLIYLNTQKSNLEHIPPQKPKEALGGDSPPQRPSS